jgi:hypothetical protein
MSAIITASPGTVLDSPCGHSGHTARALLEPVRTARTAFAE